MKASFLLLSLISSAAGTPACIGYTKNSYSGDVTSDDSCRSACEADGVPIPQWKGTSGSGKCDCKATSTSSSSQTLCKDASYDDGEDPCFARDSTIVLTPTGEVPMASLRSGDIVMDGPSSSTRVIVNQHRTASLTSSLLEIHHAKGMLSLTPDHVLEVDGKMIPARLVVPGAKLGASEVLRVDAGRSGEVINALTVSGKIMVQGGVLASCYPEAAAEYMLAAKYYPLPLSLGNALSYLFPSTTQSFYDAVIEGGLEGLGKPRRVAALPAPLIPFAILLVEGTYVAAFAAFSLASPTGVALAAVSAAAAVASRKARKC